MEKKDLKRLIKLEDRIRQIVTEDLGLKCMPIEWDVIPPAKMLEIMAYRSPTNISSWKFGRDYEKLRTIFDTVDPSLPYEVVINDDPIRAFLMNSNTLAVQALVIAHVYGHGSVFTESRWFQKSRRDIIELLAEANKRFNNYEKMYGIDFVEATIDAGHSIQWHSNPFEEETEDERRARVFEQKKMMNRPDMSEFSDIVKSERRLIFINPDNYNTKLWRELKATTPVEPVEDILRYIIDNSRVLDDAQKDILEILRTEGQYYWPVIKTKYLNEGFATYIHQIVMDKLFEEGLLSSTEHGQYNYSNSLVKARNPMTMNPYLVGSEMWKSIKDRWDKGKHGREWDDCTMAAEKENWDTKEMRGWEKCLDVMRSYTDWFFMQDFLTVKIVDDCDLYIYQKIETPVSIDYVRTEHSAEQVRDIIISSFAHSGIPKIDVVNGNFGGSGVLELVHRYAGVPLDKEYTKRTLGHINRIWGNPVILRTSVDAGDLLYHNTGEETIIEYADGKVPEKAKLRGIKKNPPFGTKKNVPLQIDTPFLPV